MGTKIIVRGSFLDLSKGRCLLYDIEDPVTGKLYHNGSITLDLTWLKPCSLKKHANMNGKWLQIFRHKDVSYVHEGPNKSELSSVYYVDIPIYQQYNHDIVIGLERVYLSQRVIAAVLNFIVEESLLGFN